MIVRSKFHVDANRLEIIMLQIVAIILFSNSLIVLLLFSQFSAIILIILRLNPLTTNDEYSRLQNSAACYQLAQSVLGEVGAYTALADSA